ncbi:hypothetical protein H5410_022477 [Solanum commersonii]|uniref:UBR-type domain-containing protein n=1 Tax=Solanum commersonii TaxID=4109 RepID=A0A9J5ZI26_SOLCO|nr:hypothetical protein H5410_022477 [Solanum commersonii]
MADAFEKGAENTVSIGEFLQDLEEQELEEDLVLGGDEGKECTYSKGYMKRHAIFSCLTCTPDGNVRVCTACCLSCHNAHEILELWTKRNFRCDYGNSKFGEFFCKLDASKDVESTKNTYNHNFKGYTAHVAGHILILMLKTNWRISNAASTRTGFIRSILVLSPLIWFQGMTKGSLSARVQQQTTTNSSRDNEVVEDAPLTVGSSKELSNGSSSVETPIADNNPKEDCNGKAVLLGENAATNTLLNQRNTIAGPSTKCVVGLNLLEAPISLEKSKLMFLSKDWREDLCRCPNCTEFYK